MIELTADDIRHAQRVVQDPFASDRVYYAVHPEMVAKDDCVFQHGNDYAPCTGCEPNLYGEEQTPHVHLVVVGSNGGMRVRPFSSMTELLEDLRYMPVGLGTVRNDSGSVVGVGFLQGGSVVDSMPVSGEAGAHLSNTTEEWDGLVEGGNLFDEKTGDESDSSS